ncbi:hypothetical protein QNJ28_00590 [Macrococcus caseolyticus]|uniref:hypothetical protein n=1 Tax=Macrococcoides caseolyticum TaxID=69966 RepID=UPI0024BC108C|nr:hypothetical protein [Macrococcus caseolyticus]MDJ1108583.1 hypothetical protein [Macrococcus caseolyticus]
MNHLQNFWNAYKWLVKGSISSHLLIITFLIRATIREDYNQILMLVLCYIALSAILFDLLESRNRLRRIKKINAFLYFEGIEASDKEIYGGYE